VLVAEVPAPADAGACAPAACEVGVTPGPVRVRGARAPAADTRSGRAPTTDPGLGYAWRAPRAIQADSEPCQAVAAPHSPTPARPQQHRRPPPRGAPKPAAARPTSRRSTLPAGDRQAPVPRRPGLTGPAAGRGGQPAQQRRPHRATASAPDNGRVRCQHAQAADVGDTACVPRSAGRATAAPDASDSAKQQPLGQHDARQPPPGSGGGAPAAIVGGSCRRDRVSRSCTKLHGTSGQDQRGARQRRAAGRLGEAPARAATSRPPSPAAGRVRRSPPRASPRPGRRPSAAPSAPSDQGERRRRRPTGQGASGVERPSAAAAWAACLAAAASLARVAQQPARCRHGRRPDDTAQVTPLVASVSPPWPGRTSTKNPCAPAQRVSRPNVG
jgi:hypothetical protein